MYSKHGMSRTAIYRLWANMKSRCERSNDKDYQYYGGRGIAVCERWQSFLNFLTDMGERPSGKSIDRIDSNGNYEPGNCRWASALEQSRNKRKTPLIVEFRGQSMYLVDACALVGISRNLGRARVKRGIPLDAPKEGNVKGANLTDAAKEKILALAMQGLHYQKIEEMCGVSQGTVHRITRKMGHSCKTIGKSRSS